MNMGIFWFCMVAFMVALYVVLDGYDLGAGIVHLFVTDGEKDRKQVLQSIHPLWDGNEVWLVAAGTTLYFAFPRLYSVSFSGFYLPLIIVLWLLILRGISIEFRNHIDSPAWRPFWDVVFGISSSLLAVFFGAALGNVVRGVPYDSTGQFFLPLWTDLTMGEEAGILDWYTILVGVTAWLVLLVHGALWVAHRTVGPIEARSRKLVNRAWPPLTVMTLVISYLSFRVQPQLLISFQARPWGVIFPALGIASCVGMSLWNNSKDSGKAFLSSCFFIIGFLTSAAFGVFPYVLPGLGAFSEQGLTIENSMAPVFGLELGLYWFIPGLILAMIYSSFVHWKFSGKIKAEDLHD